jgi:glutaredoxin
LVREVLTELDIPYQLRSAGKESPRRNELAATSVNGSTQCPYLLDPNTNTAMAESSVIIRYLYQTYALWTPPNELLQWVSLYILPLAKPLFLVLTPLQAGSSDKDNPDGYRERIAIARADVESTIRSAPVVVYTYGLSPFSFETKALLDNLNIVYKEVSLGAEWIPGLIQAGGSETRAALLEMTGQSSLPHVFIGGTSIGGLFSGTPGLLPLLEGGKLLDMVENANRGVKVAAA